MEVPSTNDECIARLGNGNSRGGGSQGKHERQESRKSRE